MKAQIKPRINLEGRTKLETVIPLETPFVVFVDPSSGCNFKCTYCPTGHLDLIKRSLKIVDKLIIGVADNYNKKLILRFFLYLLCRC